MVRESVYMQMVLVLMHTWCTHLALVLTHYMACTMAKNLFTFFYISQAYYVTIQWLEYTWE